jgi:hypothetical protein
MRSWLDHTRTAVRSAVIEGLIVSGPPRGAEAAIVRVDRWLGRQPTLDVDEARVELFGRATPAIRRAIEREAEQLSTFLGTTCSPRFR